MLSAEQVRKMYTREECRECPPECADWIGKIDAEIQRKGTLAHNMRYAFPSRDATHYSCMTRIKQHYRKQGFAISEGVYYNPAAASADMDFLDIAWKPGWGEWYYDLKDHWLGSIRFL